MPTPQAPEVLQIGFTPNGGALANLVDRDELTFWKPAADSFDSYPQPPVGDSGAIIADGSPRPCIQFDFGEQVRIPVFRIKTETSRSLGWCYLIASDNTATSLNDTVQVGDIYAGGLYSVDQINSGATLTTKAQSQVIRKRFWRFVFFKTPPAE